MEWALGLASYGGGCRTLLGTGPLHALGEAPGYTVVGFA